MIDISSARSACDAALNATPDGAAFDSMLSVVHVARAALDELEALCKPSVAASLTWDVAGEADCYARGAVSDNVMRAAEVCYLAARLGRTHEDWIARSDDEQRLYVLMVRGMVTHPDAAPAVDPREERLMCYRCAAIQGLLAGRVWQEYRVAVSSAEEIAHAMLRAERSPDAV